MKPSPPIIGVDTGGTFTDLVLVDGAKVFTWKVPSTPDDFARGVLEGVRELLRQSGATAFELVHSTTVATNALLERKVARCALVTTEGFRDVLEIGRQARPSLYNLEARKPPPLIPRALRFTVKERISAQGGVLEGLDEAECDAVAGQLAALGVESVAVCLLFSFANPRHERMLGKLLKRHGLHTSLSSEVLPEFREYERTAATVANAAVSPVMSAYLGRLTRAAKKLGATTVGVMQSNGGTLSPRDAGERAVQTLLSGPAAGIIGACDVAARALGESPRIMTFDMGGTSTDVALIDGRIELATGQHVGDLPIHVPMMDIHTVGAGGGSIAWVDAGGALRVGPESAGAAPGPACYGRGEMPTVSDANLLLGRLHPEHFLSGRMKLQPERARAAMLPLAQRLACSAEEAADAIVRIVNSNMERALRVISVQRGHDPRDFTLVSFGGAGGLHACDLAQSLGIARVLIPARPGVLSAWGCACAEEMRDFSRTVMLPLDDWRGVAAAVAALEQGALKLPGGRPGVQFHASADLRYRGQSHELNVALCDDTESTAAAFHALHERRFAHSAPGEPVEVVTVRLRAVVPRKATPRRAPQRSGGTAGAALLGREGGVSHFDRKLLKPGAQLDGPAIVFEDYSTNWIPTGWSASVDRELNLILTPR